MKSMFSNKIIQETIRIKKKYCTRCKYLVDNSCSKHRVIKECWRKKRRNEDE